MTVLEDATPQAPIHNPTSPGYISLEKEHYGVARASVALSDAVRRFEVENTADAYYKLVQARKEFDRQAGRVA